MTRPYRLTAAPDRIRRMATCHPDRLLRSRGRCNACHIQAKRSGGWEPRVGGGSRDRHRRQLYGISSADYDRMLAEQGGLCAVCQRPPVGDRPLDIDHDHRTRRVRGLIHSNCNRLAGAAEDPLMPDVLAYLARFG